MKVEAIKNLITVCKVLNHLEENITKYADDVEKSRFIELKKDHEGLEEIDPLHDLLLLFDPKNVDFSDPNRYDKDCYEYMKTWIPLRYPGFSMSDVYRSGSVQWLADIVFTIENIILDLLGMPYDADEQRDKYYEIGLGKYNLPTDEIFNELLKLKM